jgi:nicotinamide-nucleotide amidase
MKSEIVAVGTELLLGEIVDTNTSFIAQQLPALGIDLYFTSSVGDNYARLLDTLRRAWDRSDLIMTSGGLGPTQDDLTREAIAGLLGEELRVEPVLKEDLESFFAQRGLEMTQNNIKQAMLIPSAEALPNPRGTAPGWWVEKEGRTIVAMPGPPGELRFMWQNEVFPRLQQRSEAVIVSRTIKTFGLGESKVEEVVSSLVASANPSLATYAKTDGIYLRITAKASGKDEAERMVVARESEVRQLLGDYIWGADDDTPQSATGRLLSEAGLSIAVGESFRAGFLSYLFGGEGDSGEYFKGGVVVTARAGRVALGLEPDATTKENSDSIAAAMASLARRKFDADIGIGTAGYTEKANEADIDRVSLALESRTGKRRTAQYSGRPDQMKTRAAYYALLELRRLLTSAL